MLAAEMDQMYAKFNAWKDKFQSQLVDLGGRLGAGSVVTSDGVADGPFVEVKEVVGGFMIVSAESMEEAIEVARECPGVVSPGSSVEPLPTSLTPACLVVQFGIYGYWLRLQRQCSMPSISILLNSRYARTSRTSS